MSMPIDSAWILSASLEPCVVSVIGTPIPQKRRLRNDLLLWALHPLLAANGPISGTQASAQHSSFVAVLFRKAVLICQQDDTVLS